MFRLTSIEYSCPISADFKKFVHGNKKNAWNFFPALSPSPGGTPYKKGGDARQEISNEPLKGTNLDVALAEFYL